MLCAKCHEREVTVHHVKIQGDETIKADYCAECAETEVGSEKCLNLNALVEDLESGSITPHMALKELIGENPRYPLAAYEFVTEALEGSLYSGLPTGRGLLKAMRELAVKKFGKQTRKTLADWKIFRTEDFGEVLFEMIGSGMIPGQFGFLREDFQNGFDFDAAFPET